MNKALVSTFLATSTTLLLGVFTTKVLAITASSTLILTFANVHSLITLLNSVSNAGSSQGAQRRLASRQSSHSASFYVAYTFTFSLFLLLVSIIILLTLLASYELKGMYFLIIFLLPLLSYRTAIHDILIASGQGSYVAAKKTITNMSGIALCIISYLTGNSSILYAIVPLATLILIYSYYKKTKITPKITTSKKLKNNLSVYKEFIILSIIIATTNALGLITLRSIINGTNSRDAANFIMYYRLIEAASSVYTFYIANFLYVQFIKSSDIKIYLKKMQILLAFVLPSVILFYYVQDLVIATLLTKDYVVPNGYKIHLPTILSLKVVDTFLAYIQLSQSLTRSAATSTIIMFSTFAVLLSILEGPDFMSLWVISLLASVLLRLVTIWHFTK